MITVIRSLLSVLLIAHCTSQIAANAVMIEVFAGDDTSVCYGQNINLADLEATITGIGDGSWVSFTDGQFLPGGLSFVTFSIATLYQPGPQDLSNGFCELILVSDDPDGIGPLNQVSDTVIISLVTTPAMVCNSQINVALAETCQQQVDVFMVLTNPQPPYSMYEITVTDENGAVVPDNILTADHVGQELSFEVVHICSGNNCDGSLTASDNIAPFLNCLAENISCTQSTLPEVTGFPIPFFATATQVGDQTYLVENLDACGTVTLSYSDDEVNMDCVQGLSKIVTRLWSAEDPNGNSSQCTQTINVEVAGLDSVDAPQNFDNITGDALACDGDWEQLSNGYPSPAHTGMPTFGNCTNLDATYTDSYFEQCGASFKIIRKWLVIDWCTSESININQVIKVVDIVGPEFLCPADTIIGTDAYSCVSEDFQAMFMEEVEDCSDWTYEINIIDENGINQSAAYVNGLTIEQLPVGEYTLVYVLTDACNNSSECLSTITVIDDKAPFAVCDGFTKVSIQNTGVARLFATSVDESSYDNCAIVSMEVQKMTDLCGNSTAWAPFVDFCCAEVGDSIMVQFRVTDANGLSNTCMVEVRVEDKIDPQIYCPSDLTISCDYIFDETDLSVFGQVHSSSADVQSIVILDRHNNGVAGQDGYYQENCEATIMEDSNVAVDCGSGSITRTFTVTDNEGNMSTCTQTITVVNDDPMLDTDIQWPANYHDIGCDTIDARPEVAGSPVITGDHCSSAASTYEDQTFFFSGGACIKILRYWTVVDWCQFDAVSGAGTWSYIQEIKLFNTEAPQTVGCSDQVVCDYDDCGSHELFLPLIAIDDCTKEEYLTYAWSIDFDDDGVVDETGVTDLIELTVPYGLHRVMWSVADGCNNKADCDFTVTVQDCKNPTPYCHNSITTTLMPSAGSLTIWASDYNLGSDDNCTDQSELIYSFSENILNTTRTLTCDDIPNGIAAAVPLEMWVTDEAGNQDFCTVQIILQDNSDICQDGSIKGSIAGHVRTWNNHFLKDVNVRYDCVIDDFDGEVMTDVDGAYTSPAVPEYLPYGVRPSSSYAGGRRSDVNSIDLVKIQRHILQLDTIDSPYDLIAADVSGNGRVQPSDLLQIRKFVLGIFDEFPKTAKWEFIPESYIFPDPMDPFDYLDSIEIASLLEELDTINFIAIRMGNVDGRFNFTDDDDISFRGAGSQTDLSYRTELIDGFYRHSFYVEELLTYQGLQIGLECLGGNMVAFESTIIPHDEYHIKEGLLNIAHTHMGGHVEAGEVLFTVVSDCEQIDLQLNSHYKSFMYDESEEPIALSKYAPQAANAHGLEVVLLENPFTNALRFKLAGARVGVPAAVTIYDLSGHVVYEGEVADYEEVIVPAEQFSVGAYILQVSSGEETVSHKVIKI